MSANNSGQVLALQVHPLAYTDEHFPRSAADIDNVNSHNVSNLSAQGSHSARQEIPGLPLSEENGFVSVLLGSNVENKGKFYFIAVCWCIFLLGWNDGSTGPLLPVIQRDYQVGFSFVSLIFVVNCVGYIMGGFLNVWLNDRFGLGKVMVLGSGCQLIMYAILSPAPPFPLLLFAYGIGGFGMSLQNAQANGFVASSKEHKVIKLGLMHAAYGLGAFICPFLATFFSGQKNWSFHFLVAGVLSLSNVTVLFLVFRLRKQHEILIESNYEPEEITARNRNAYRQIIGLRAVHFLALFVFLYIGVEVTLGGWIVTFIINERHGGHNSGYISSGFFGGLTAGRVVLMGLNKMIGERRVIFLYSILAIALELSIWFIPSVIGNAISISFIGFFLGPMFPILISHSTRILPPRLITGSIGFITGIGVSGAAVLPLITGILASRYGIGSLQPLMVAMMTTMVLLWACVPATMDRPD